MKISSVSKKVLAGALSAAMVVAFSPVAALGASNTGNNAAEVEKEIGHTLDNGVRTNEPTCTDHGMLTYTAIDDPTYKLLASIARPEHSYSLTEVKWNLAGTQVVKATFTCATGNEKVVYAYGVGTNIGTATATAISGANFSAGAKTEYKVEITDPAGKKYTETNVVEGEPVSVAAGITASNVTWSDGNGVARVDISNASGAQTLVASTTAKAAKTTDTGVAISEGDPTYTEYTAEFALPEGIYFSGTAGKLTANISAITGTGVSKEIKDGKLVVKKIVKDDPAGTSQAHTISKGETFSSSNFTAATATDPEKYVTTDGVTLTYSGAGSIADGTASENGVWTFEAECKYLGHTSTTIAVPKDVVSVTKSSCDTGSGTGKTVAYTVKYNGGEFVLKVAGLATSGTAGHTYVAKDTVWSYDGTDFTAVNEYVCAVDGDAYKVTMKSDKTLAVEHKAAGGSYSAHTITGGATVVADTSVKATCLAKGAINVALSVKNDNLSTANTSGKLIAELGVTPSATFTGTYAKEAGDEFTATVDWATSSNKAIVTIKNNDGLNPHKFAPATVALTSEAVAPSFTATGATAIGAFNAGGTLYTGEIALPEGVKQLYATNPNGNIVNWDNASKLFKSTEYTADGIYFDEIEGKYYIKKLVATPATGVTGVACADVITKGLYGTSDPAKWTVTENGKGYAVTAISVADIAHTKKAPKVQKAYTLTYNGGKTITVNCTGWDYAHKWELKDFAITGAALTAAETVTPHLHCADCGETVDAQTVSIAANKTTVEKAVVKTAAVAGKSVAGDEIGTFNFARYAATANVYTAPTFKWTATGTTPLVEATFVSADGKMKVEVPAAGVKVELIDAEKSIFKATVKDEYIPEGYTGSASETKTFNLHEGHVMPLISVTKATTTKAGFATYYCNDCMGEYKVAIAKNNMKVSPTSKTFKASVVKKKAQSVTIKVTNAKGKVSYSVAAKTKKAGVSVSSKGKVTVKKGTKKGTYKVTVTSKATDTYAKATKTVTIRVK